MITAPILFIAAMSAGVIWFIVMIIISAVSRYIFGRTIFKIIGILAESAVACEEAMRLKTIGKDFDDDEYYTRFASYTAEMSTYIFDEAEPYSVYNLGFIELLIYPSPYKWFVNSGELIDIVNSRLESVFIKLKEEFPDKVPEGATAPRVNILTGGLSNRF